MAWGTHESSSNGSSTRMSSRRKQAVHNAGLLGGGSGEKRERRSRLLSAEGDKLWGEGEGEEEVEEAAVDLVVTMVRGGWNGKEEDLSPRVCLRRRMDQH